MDATTRLFDWGSDRLVLSDPAVPDERELLVADSFLVSSGRVLALPLHQRRFTESAAAAGFRDTGEVERFWRAGLAALPRDDEWFPRFELVRTPQGVLRLSLRLRPAPERGDTLVVATADGDPRRCPDRKGPDIDRLNVLRQAALRRGAQEAVILDAGRVSDGTTTALLWWRGDVLFAPPFEFARVDSVSARTVRGIAAALGIPVEEEAARPAQLDGAVLWAVNALHGIRSVTAWVDGPALTQDDARTSAWRARCSALARPLPAA